MEALGINLGMLVSQLFNFTLLAVLLYFVAYKPILRMLDERSAGIKKGLEDAETASKRSAEMEQEFERRMAEARKLAEIFRLNGLDIPNEKWFVNLKSVWNVGAGSIFLMLDEVVRSGELKKGNKILIAVPESSRFSYMMRSSPIHFFDLRSRWRK